MKLVESNKIGKLSDLKHLVNQINILTEETCVVMDSMEHSIAYFEEASGLPRYYKGAFLSITIFLSPEKPIQRNTAKRKMKLAIRVLDCLIKP